MAAQAAVVPRSSGRKARGWPLAPQHVRTGLGLVRSVRVVALGRNVAAPAATGASGPAMAAPQARPSGRPGDEQTRGTGALPPLEAATDRARRGESPPPMARSRRAARRGERPRLLTGCADTSAAPFRARATPPLVAFLGEPDQRAMARTRRLGALVSVTHAPEGTDNRLTLLPQGGSFAPPNWRR